MSNQSVELLGQIYSALSNISTKGEDTIVMADCLRALVQILQDESAETANPETAEVE